MSNLPWKRLGIWVLVGVIFVASVYGYRRWESGPTYRGASLREWLIDGYQHGNEEGLAEALRGLGSRALPYLERTLYARDTPFRQLTFEFLGSQFVFELSPLDAASLRYVAARALGMMGAEAAPAVPALTSLLNSREAGLRGCVISTLGQIGPAAVQAVPGLTALSATNSPDRLLALSALCSISPADALPLVDRAVADPDPRVRAVALILERRIAPEGGKAEEGNGSVTMP